MGRYLRALYTSFFMPVVSWTLCRTASWEHATFAKLRIRPRVVLTFEKKISYFALLSSFSKSGARHNL